MGLFNFWRKKKYQHVAEISDTNWFDDLQLRTVLKEEFLDKRKNVLVDLLIDFIKNKTPLLIADSSKLCVINFEYDTPFDFCYAGYPDPNIIAQEHWEDQFEVDCSLPGDEEVLEKIMAGEGFEERGYAEWIHIASNKAIDAWSIFQSVEESFFSECWQLAKEHTGSSLRCFFFQHDIYRGVDADTGKPADSDDVINILTAEDTTFILIPGETD